MTARPIKWEAWKVEHHTGHLPTYVRDGVVRNDGRAVSVYLSRGDESRYCRTWHVGVKIAGKLVHQSGSHIAEDRRTAQADVVYRACRLVDVEGR